jgi:hypothetical protein
MTLDDIIQQQKKTKGGRGRAAGGGGGRRRAPVAGRARLPRREGGGGAAFSSDVPSGKWQHDKFFEVYGGKGKGAGGGSFARRGGAVRLGGRGGGSQTVKLNLSNLAPSVVTDDLRELFSEYGVFDVAVHFDENGAHLGTADVLATQSVANTILREFADVKLDGKQLRFAIVDENSARASIRDRVQRVGGGIRRARGGAVQKRTSGGGPRRSASAGARKSDGGAGKRISKMSADDLDKELEAYMGSKNA